MGASIADRVRAQYERHPYPPVSALALPRRKREAELALETGLSLAPARIFPAHPRILVAGCGSLEALVVARANPRAERVVAVDLSEHSLQTLKRRVQLARIVQPFTPQAPIETRQCNLHALHDGPFDAIFLSNVLQHVASPEALVAHLAALLAPHGLMRLVVYPRESRLWMRALQRYLEACGLDAHTQAPRRSVTRRLHELPEASPLRSTFFVNPESSSDAGVVDAFLHAHDDPLPLAQLASCIHRAGLKLVGERQTPSSQSAFVGEVDAQVAASVTNPWSRLELLDESLELCANPVFWLARGESEAAPLTATTTRNVAGTVQLFGHALHVSGPLGSLANVPAASTIAAVVVPNPIGAALACRVSRLDDLLARVGISSDAWIASLAREVGPRVTPPPNSRDLPGLALSDNDPHALRGLSPPVADEDLDALEAWLLSAHGLVPSRPGDGASHSLRHAVRLASAQGSVLANSHVLLTRS